MHIFLSCFYYLPLQREGGERLEQQWQLDPLACQCVKYYALFYKSSLKCPAKLGDNTINHLNHGCRDLEKVNEVCLCRVFTEERKPLLSLSNLYLIKRNSKKIQTITS